MGIMCNLPSTINVMCNLPSTINIMCNLPSTINMPNGSRSKNSSFIDVLRENDFLNLLQTFQKL